MAGVEGRVNLRKQLLNFTKQAKIEQKKEAVEQALIAGIVAKNAGQNTIATTPSDLSIEPKGNRIWTGAMWEDFDAEVDQKGNRITLKIGWIKKKRKYYTIQEYGGVVPTKRGPITVTAMHAITNATMAAQRHLDNKGIK
jgi:hypothetical protein